MRSVAHKSYAASATEPAHELGPPPMLALVILAVLAGGVLALIAVAVGLGPLRAALAFPIAGWVTLILGALLISHRNPEGNPSANQRTDNRKE